MAWLIVGATVLGLAVGSVLGTVADRTARRVAVSRWSLGAEMATAGAFAAVAWRFGWSWTLPAELTFTAGLAALAACDLHRLVLPKRLVVATAASTALWLLAATMVEGSWHRFGVAVAAATVAYGCFFALNWARPEWLGFGDVRLAGLIGLALGWISVGCALLGFVAANVIGLVAAAGLLATRRVTRRSPLPYGVFLAVGAVVALVGAGAG